MCKNFREFKIRDSIFFETKIMKITCYKVSQRILYMYLYVCPTYNVPTLPTTSATGSRASGRGLRLKLTWERDSLILYPETFVISLDRPPSNAHASVFLQLPHRSYFTCAHMRASGNSDSMVSNSLHIIPENPLHACMLRFYTTSTYHYNAHVTLSRDPMLQMIINGLLQYSYVYTYIVDVLYIMCGGLIAHSFVISECVFLNLRNYVPGMAGGRHPCTYQLPPCMYTCILYYACDLLCILFRDKSVRNFSIGCLRRLTLFRNKLTSYSSTIFISRLC